MIPILVYLSGLAALALVPLLATRILLTGMPVPRVLKPDGRMPPLIAARSAEIGRRIGALSLDAVGPLRELAVALGPADIAAAVNAAFASQREAILHRVAAAHLGVMWRSLPGAAKVQFEDHLARTVPRAVDRAMDEIVASIDDLIDIPAMQERYFGARPAELARMVTRVATPGFQALMLLLPGLALLPLLLPAFAPGVLPMLAGTVMGYGVGRLAVDWLFTPPPTRWRHRLPARGFTPLLPERRMITTLYVDTVAHESFRLDVVIDELVGGRGALATRAIVERRVAAIFARLPGGGLLNLVIPRRAMQGMIEAATTELLTLLQVTAREPELVARCAERLGLRVRDKLDALDEMAFLGMQRNVLRSELPLMHGTVAGVFLVVGLAAALL